MKEKAIRKAAIFLMSLGPEVGGQIMSKLPEEVVENLAHYISTIGHVTFGEKKKIMADFISTSSKISGIAFGGEETAKQIL